MSDLNIEKYPSVIVRPYNLACQQDEQWKDLLRFTFENLMTVLASYAASDLLNIYMSAKNPSEEKANGYIKYLDEHKPKAQ